MKNFNKWRHDADIDYLVEQRAIIAWEGKAIKEAGKDPFLVKKVRDEVRRLQFENNAWYRSMKERIDAEENDTHPLPIIKKRKVLKSQPRRVFSESEPYFVAPTQVDSQLGEDESLGEEESIAAILEIVSCMCMAGADTDIYRFHQRNLISALFDLKENNGSNGGIEEWMKSKPNFPSRP